MKKNCEIVQCESTNDEVRKLARQGEESGTWISARVQTSGRGRRHRKWSSEEGNLFCSVLLRPENKFKYWTWIPLMTAVAIVEALEALYGNTSVKIKWPNDLIWENAKLGGILCEGSSSASGEYVVVGFGVNCEISPDVGEYRTTCLREIFGQKIDLEGLRNICLEKILDLFQLLQTEGPSPLLLAYENFSLFPSGSLVSWFGASGKGNGQVKGLGAHGELVVLLSDGKEKHLTSEEVSVRHYQGQNQD